MRYEIERLADGVLDAMPEDPYPLRVMQARPASVPIPCKGRLCKGYSPCCHNFGEMTSGTACSGCTLLWHVWSRHLLSQEVVQTLCQPMTTSASV